MTDDEIRSCKMCGKNSGLVNAHIVPRRFYPNRGKGSEPLKVLTNFSRPGKSRIGIYDDNLVCKDCEEKFDPFDNYAAKLLFDEEKLLQPIRNDGQIVGYGVAEFDYFKLKMFCLMMLWRAAASDRAEFVGVDLGPFLQILAQMIEKSDAGEPQTFACIISRFSDDMGRDSGVLLPFREKLSDLNFYRFVAGTYVFYIKVDHQSCRDPLGRFILCPDAPLFILAREFHNGPEHRAFFEIVKKSATNFPRKPKAE